MSSGPAATPQGSTRAQEIQLVLGYSIGTAVVLAFFVRFVLPSWHYHFAPDDPMALYYYWSRGPWSLIKGLVFFPSTYLRPMHGVYYSVLYHFFGLNPLPYHVVISCLILLNAFLAFRFAFLITDSRWIGGLTALVVTYHAELAALVYMPSFCNDVISFTFFFLTLNFYIVVRKRGTLLNAWQAAAFLLLYICALDSKETAVSLPVVALLFEAIWHPPSWRVKGGALIWLRREALVPLLAAIVTLVYIVGKTHGTESLVTNPQYQTVYTWHRFVEANLRFFDTFFFLSFKEHAFTAGKLLLLLLAALLLCWQLRSRHLLFAVMFLIVTPLPITFIPLRPGANLYIPLVGWAIAVATVWLALAKAFRQFPVVCRIPLRGLEAVLALTLVVWLWKSNVRASRRFVPPLLSMQTLTWSAIEQLRAVQPAVKPGNHIIFLNDPFQGWNMKFIAELLYHDHTVTATLNRMTPASSDQLDNADLLFDWRDDHLVIASKP